MIWASRDGGKREAMILSQLRDILDSTETDFLVFTQTVCPYCTLAFRTLDAKGLSFTDVNLDHYDGLRQAVVSETGHRTVPVVFDMRDEDPVFIGGSDNLLEYL
jgi:glutaredoxin